MKPPCIRGLHQFKKGCPEQKWNGESGCPCWIELSVGTVGNPLQKEIKKQCIDLWNHEFQWASLGAMEGVQQAMEGNRNMLALASLVVSGKETPELLAQQAANLLNYKKP